MCLVSVRSLVRGSKGRLIEKIQGRGEILQPFAMNTFHFYNRESQYYVVAFFFSSSLAYIYYFFFFFEKVRIYGHIFVFVCGGVWLRFMGVLCVSDASP